MSKHSLMTMRKCVTNGLESVHIRVVSVWELFCWILQVFEDQLIYELNKIPKEPCPENEVLAFVGTAVVILPRAVWGNLCRLFVSNTDVCPYFSLFLRSQLTMSFPKLSYHVPSITIIRSCFSMQMLR